MNSDLLFVVGLLLLSFSAKLYVNVVSLVFESLFIKFFRSMYPGYITSYARAFLLSILSFRNQGISFTALSFLNSGIIPNFQALGLILGSYLGLAFSIFYLNLYDTPFKYVFIALALSLSIFNKDRVIHIAKMFFSLAMLLFAFELLALSVFSLSEPLIINIIKEILALHRLMIVPFTFLIFILFRNTFTVLSILYLFFLSGIIVQGQVLNSILSVIIYNSFWYLWCTNSAHRETRAVSYATVLLTLIAGILLVAIEILLPNSIITAKRTTLYFTFNLISLCFLMGLIGWPLSRILNLFTDNFFPKSPVKESRHIQLFTSKNNYPIAFLIEFFELEFKKLFALLNSAQQLAIGSWNQFQEDSIEKTQKYFNIMNKVLKELSDLEIQLNQVEKTKKQAITIFQIHDQLVALNLLASSLMVINDIFHKISFERFENLKAHKSLFVNTSQKVLEFSEYVFSKMMEKEKDDARGVDPITISTNVAEELTKFKDEFTYIKSQNEFSKEEDYLFYQYIEQIQLLNISIQKIAK